MQFVPSGETPSWQSRPKLLSVSRWLLFLSMTIVLLLCTRGLSQKVTISGKGLMLEQVFMEIRKQTGLDFLYQASLFKNTQPITINVKQMPVEEVLKICLEGQGMCFTIRSGTVIIFRMDDPAHSEIHRQVCRDQDKRQLSRLGQQCH